MTDTATTRTPNTHKPLNATAASLLGFLHEGPKSGWDLVSEAHRRIGDFWTITQSQVYRELAAMDASGLVTKGETGARERTPFHITTAGREAFREWVCRDPGRETIRAPLLLTLSFGEHLDRARLDGIVLANREIHQQRLTRYLAEDSDTLSVFARAARDFGIRHERAVLEWFDHLPELLDS
ncbi:PadR family transcriptional regulator [Nocardia sp. CNY236]|uniref:PadR family transcriptional regulator n=1 Tax=Nocardia sp. CNY236 TaxID=1169152 RepID=UPI00048E5F13|nr:PadR family transcriptional regulator [Nocardia sp. CNY236]